MCPGEAWAGALGPTVRRVTLDMVDQLCVGSTCSLIAYYALVRTRTLGPFLLNYSWWWYVADSARLEMNRRQARWS